MASSYFPLRWEGTGDQWWYASPIDWAAANGHYDLVRELLHLDSNLLIKLTSLRRILRLETLWDDEVQFNHVAQCRSLVARKLLLESESKPEANSLIQAGYGGWLLYTAASAGDISFVQELLDRDPLLVFGQGEYGVTDILYAVSRSKNSQVFRVLLGKYLLNTHGDFDSTEAPSAFKWEMMNRALHAAARGGNLEMLKELVEDCTDALAYRDVHGFTILHSASGRGQIEIVKYLVATYEIITSTDINGTTALHVAAFYGQTAVVEALIQSTPSSVSLRNNSGDTFLHMAVAGFQVPGFRRLDQHIELIKHLTCGKTVDLHDIINVRNNDGKTALHNAVAGIIDVTLVEVLLSVPSIDLNIYDADGLNPLDVLSQQPHTLATDILIKDLISAGGIQNCQGGKAKRTIVSQKKRQGIGSSPGTGFGIPDAKILSYMESDALGSSVRLSPCSSDSINSSNNSDSKKRSSVIHTRRHLKSLFRWSRQWNKLSDSSVNEDGEESAEQNNIEKKFSTEPTQDTIQAIPQMDSPSSSPSASFSRRSMCSTISFDKKRVAQCRHETGDKLSSSPSFGDKTADMTRKSASTSKRLMDQYFCFGTEDVVIVDRKTARSKQHQIRTLAIPSVG